MILPLLPRMASGRRAFTLVELIVVITILAILGTIGFLSLNGYSTGARDAARTSDLVQLAKQLDGIVARGTLLPQPDNNAIALLSSGTVVGTQGYAGTNVLGIVGFGGKAKDPLDGQYYTYLTNASRTRYQVLGLAEGSTVALTQPLIPSAYAADYATRTPVSRGGQLGVFLWTVTGSTLNQPVQELASGSFTGIELLLTSNGAYKAYLEWTKTLSGTGNVFFELAGRLDTSIGTYPGCDTPNLKLPNGQIWAACNLGATTAYANQSTVIADTSAGGGPTSTQKAYMGTYFQWGRNIDVRAAGLIVWPVATDTGSGFITASVSPYDWLITANGNLWWGSVTTPSSGTFTGATTSDQTLMRGPCAAGYHVPTALEWCNALRSVSPDITSCDGTFRNETAPNLFRTTLKMPISGYRSLIDGTFGSSGANGYYHSVSPFSGNVYMMEVSTSQVRAAAGHNRAHGFSVRCLKN